MKKRLPFLSLFVIFSLMTIAFLGMALSGNMQRTLSRHYLIAFGSALGAVLSLVGIIFPEKMKWLLKKRDEE